MGIYIRVDKQGWQPGVNTYAYYTYDDQNSSYITDASGNNRNMTSGTMPTYSLVQGTNYAGNYANVSSGVGPSLSSVALGTQCTVLAWVKITTETSMYISLLTPSGGQMSLIYGFNSGQFEYFAENRRSTILSGASLNTWYLIGYTRDGTTVKTYANGAYVGDSSFANTSITNGTYYFGCSNAGDRMKGQIGECIVENKVRTAQEFSDYYDLTKGNYGIN